MSFGYSVGDVLAVGQLCWQVYKKCKDSPGNYAELASEVGALHNVVKETEELVSQQQLTSQQESKLVACRQGCESVLKDLDGLLVKYESLGTNTRRTFDRMGFGTQDMNGIRLRLISNTSLLDAFNNLSSQARLENKMNILIAEVRAGKREGSVISTTTFDATAQIDRDTWEALRRDLEDVGISRDVITEKRQFIITWFQEAIAAGNLQEDTPADDEDLAVSVHGSDGAVDGASVLGMEMTSSMIEPFRAEENTPRMTVPKAQRSLHGPSAITNSGTDTATVLSSKKVGKPRIRISHLFYKLGWKGDKLECKRFLDAAQAGHVATVNEMLEKGIYYDCTDEDGRTALILAAKAGHESVVRLLLENGANIEVTSTMGETSLVYAASNGHESVVRLLLEKGVNTESTNIHGDTSLIYAAANGYESVVQVLLEKGANIECTNAYDETALTHSARYGHDLVVQVLLEKGANIESVTNFGETALWIAAGAGHESVVRLLLGKGANVHTKDQDGLTAFFAAKDNETVARLLRNAGARD